MVPLLLSSPAGDPDTFRFLLGGVSVNAPVLDIYTKRNERKKKKFKMLLIVKKKFLVGKNFWSKDILERNSLGEGFIGTVNV